MIHDGQWCTVLWFVRPSSSGIALLPCGRMESSAPSSSFHLSRFRPCDRHSLVPMAVLSVSTVVAYLYQARYM
ncbi:hypothetical protein BDN71DRAFT_1443978 [Pleurotus eryngii]|uniref:Uncharacterized protein n=1 Tax=Pleurotus eryngii TaxID=5323 RepID=A0A9P6D9A9_PLEER|nr:hypothetical protein BDN71DRAFT_1443978 [Pleurotus eryngii]